MQKSPNKLKSQIIWEFLEYKLKNISDKMKKIKIKQFGNAQFQTVKKSSKLVNFWQNIL